MSNLIKIFINPAKGRGPDDKAPEAYAQQLQYFKQVWDEESYGLERIVRLFLCGVQLFYPILLIRDISGRWGATGRKLAVEAYTVLKFLFPLVMLGMGWCNNPWVIIATAYFLSETLVHVLHLIFLSDIHAVVISYRRSLLLLFLHYAEVAFDFAVFYMAFDVLSRPVDPVTALYFSFVVTTTVGFGDVYARNPLGQIMVMSQLMVCVVFAVVFINYFAQEKK